MGLLVVTGRVLFDSRVALLAGEAAQAHAAWIEAIRHHHHAVRMYTPGSPFVARALDHLFDVAQGAHQRQDVVTERLALEAVRAGLLGARSFYTPFADRLALADDRLAVIYAQTEDAALARGASLADRTRHHGDLLARRPGAGLAASLLAVGGFVVWLGAAVVFTRRGIDRTLTVNRPWALWLGLVFVLGLAAFFVGLRLA